MKTIYELLKPYNKEEIDFVLKKLSSKDKSLIYLRYGIDLNNPNSSNWRVEYNYEFYSRLMPRVKRLLARSRDGKSISNGRLVTSIYCKFKEYSKEEINYVINLLPDNDKYILFLRYGDDLENPDLSNWKTEYESKLSIVYKKIKTGLLKKKNGEKIEFKINGILTVYQIFSEYSREDIEEVLKELSLKEKRLLFYRYGSDLNNPNSSNWSIEYYVELYKKLFPKIKRRLESNLRRRNGLNKEVVIDYNNKLNNLEVLRIAKLTLEKLNDESYSILLEKYSIQEILSYVLIEEMNDNYKIEDVINFLKLDRKEIIHMATKVLHNVISDEKYYLKVK